ncbi:Lipid A deacylase [Bordetella tumbae]|uniref:acyloxyacyl hydrolase n=1 Tax=Bordetella tumbae TaxID=1649139 RepID=UPI0039EE9274
MLSFNNKNMLAAAAALSLAGLACSAQAQSQGGIGLHYGVGDHYSRTELVYETPSLELYRFGGNWGHIDLNGEFGAAYWSANGSRDPSHVWQFNAIPMFRWWMSDRFYVEAGIGATLFTHTRFADENISTAYQFGDHVGLGFLVTPNNRLGLRYSHFSNASIKRPNPGLDVLQLTYTYQF